MISDFLIITSVCGFSLGLTACCIFLFSNRNNAFANRLLALTLFCLTAIMAVTFLLEWNLGYYAYIYRFPSPLYYLILPSAYLYLRSVVNKEQAFRKNDCIHFVPALFHLFEMIPFYFTSYQYRLSLVRQIPLNPGKLLALDEGWLPANYHTIIRFIQGCVYIFLMVVILIREKRKIAAPVDQDHTGTYHWLSTFTSMMAILAVPMIIYFIFPGTEAIQSTRLLFTVIAVSFLIMNLYLFFRPQILYGIPGMAGTASDKSLEIGEIQTEKEFDGEISHPGVLNLEYYKPLLEQYMANEKPFLKQGYSISELAAETGIPQHHLSALLNRVYEVRFTDFLNRMRIKYIRENFHREGWHQLTLEGIAKIAGFNSRTTFFNAIKKATGLTPSEFMMEIKFNHPTQEVHGS